MKFCVKRYWEVCDEVEVEAKNKDEAIEKAHEMRLSKYPEYVPDSINSDPETDVQKL